MMYIADDGSYGDAYGLVLIDTSLWTGDDWEDFNLGAEDGENLKAMAEWINAGHTNEKDN